MFARRTAGRAAGCIAAHTAGRTAGHTAARAARLLPVLALCGAGPLAAAPDFAALEQSIVRIVTITADGQSLGSGTGFVIDAAGRVATNYHVVDDSRDVRVVATNTASLRPAQIVARAEDLDLAVLQVPGLELPPLALSAAEPRKGQQVWAIGYPGGADRESLAADPTVQDGVIGRIFSGSWNPRHSRNLDIIQHNAPSSPGNSGGPLLDHCGRVVGVNTQASMVPVEVAGGVTRVPHAAGIYWASHVKEAMKMLRRGAIPFRQDDAVCAAAGATALEDALAQAGADAQQLRQSMEEGARGLFILLLLLFGAVLALLLLLLKKPRQQLVYAAERAGERLSRSVGGGRPAKKTPPAPLPPHGLTLAGIDGSGRRVHLALAPARFAGQRLGLSLGRHSGLVDEVVSDRNVSRRHLRIACRRGRFYIEDLNSANGTFLNERRLRPFRPETLEAGARVSLGGLQLSVDRLL